MLHTSDVVKTNDEITTAILAARILINDEKWLSKQSLLKPNDPVLISSTIIDSQNQLIHRLKGHEATHKLMHPVAEAIIGAERIIENFARSGNLLTANFLLLLTSLRDLSLYIEKIKGGRDRIGKLKSENWRPTLYELLSASSLATAHSVEVIQETSTPTPDLHISEPEIYIECKARSAASEKVVNFVKKFRQQALGEIIEEIQKVGNGLHISMEIHDDAIIDKLPSLLKKLFANKETLSNNKSVTISIIPYQFGPFALPHPMRLASPELWLWLMNFKEFDEWHFVLPNAECKIQNNSRTIVTHVQKPVLLCVRSSKLKSTSPSLRQLIKTAYQRQLKAPHTPGAVRVLVNTAHFSLESDIDSIARDLETLGNDVLRECTGLSAIYFDIVKPPGFGDFITDYRNLVIVKDVNCDALLKVPGVILF